MERRIIITKDGSNSVEIPEMNVTYHSVHGAIEESKHVFIEAGLNFVLSNSFTLAVNIFEMGLGTGLNALLTSIESERQKVKAHYTAVEQFPISAQEARLLNYPEFLGHSEWLSHIHNSVWNQSVVINDFFIFNKLQTNLLNFSTSQQFNLIYYDAFAPNAQPELWTKEIFEKLFLMLDPEGVLVTYCSKGDVRRAMMAAGFKVEKLKGPPGKREMLRATSPQPSSPKV